MKSLPEEIASVWGEQMQRGYLKLAILFALSKSSLHGYEMMKRINELTLGLIKPTAGGIYPTLRELEEMNLISGEWHLKKRRKVYRITENGRNVFRELVEKHFDLVSSVRSWILKALVDMKIIEDEEASPMLMPAFRVLLLRDDASNEEKIEALRKLETEFKNLTILLNMMTIHAEERIKELENNKS